MDALKSELDQLQKEQSEAKEAVLAANTALNTALKELQIKLADAKAWEAQVIQRLAPLQRLFTELETSGGAVREQQQLAAGECAEAEKYYADVFPLVSKEVDTKAVKVLQDAEHAMEGAAETCNGLGQQIEEAQSAFATVQANAAAAEARVRVLANEYGGLSTKIGTARQRLGKLLAAVRSLLSAGKTREVYLALRDLERERSDLAKLSTEDVSNKLLKEIETTRDQMAKAKKETTDHSSSLDAMKQKLTEAEADLAQKRTAETNARAALAAGAHSSWTKIPQHTAEKP